MSEYLTVPETADLLRLSEWTVRHKISSGVFLQGVHYFRRRGGIGIRFKRSALIAWLEAEEEQPAGLRQLSHGELRSLTAVRRRATGSRTGADKRREVVNES